MLAVLSGRRKDGVLWLPAFAAVLVASVLLGCWKGPDRSGESSQGERMTKSDEGQTETGGSSEPPDRKSKTLAGEQVYQRIKRSLALVTSSSETEKRLGSGFFVGSGVLVTNRHMVADATRIQIRTLGRQDRSRAPAREVARHPVADIAILRTRLSQDALPFGNFSEVEVGETVFVGGNPEGLEATFSRGVVSAIRSRETVRLLQVTAPVSEGSSGGPVLNEQGKVIGVVSAVHREGQNLNFAVPVSYVRETLNQMK